MKTKTMPQCRKSS